jgi:hypothetical protein
MDWPWETWVIIFLPTSSTYFIHVWSTLETEILSYTWYLHAMQVQEFSYMCSLGMAGNSLKE